MKEVKKKLGWTFVIYLTALVYIILHYLPYLTMIRSKFDTY